MEKRIWILPQAEVEKFEMNAYCASACGDSNRVYTFTCDAGGGDSGRVVGSDGVTSHYHACGETHATDVLINGADTSDFITGTYEKCYYSWGQHKHYEPIDVIIWRGEDGKNTHCTTALDIESWETTKS